MVDEDLILRKRADVELYVSQLAEYRGISADEYRRDWKVQRIVERTLQMVIGTCLDIASHLVSDSGSKVPGTYAETFVSLREAGLLAQDLCDAMVRMTGFRNVLAQESTHEGPEIVVRLLRDGLGDLERFVSSATGES